ncbi:hypothetical protein NDU88_004248 [Pleurodeles waltl]|uniref:Uncharacterized protein n=1 Tax=Pleurodeles waltl TaxID=8319 RepID=A0AAV7SIF0_PLEWA|nr:hypothetical protein NDU88_004248 [Pleurodeles waltl]
MYPGGKATKGTPEEFPGRTERRFFPLDAGNFWGCDLEGWRSTEEKEEEEAETWLENVCRTGEMEDE